MIIHTSETKLFVPTARWYSRLEWIIPTIYLHFKFIEKDKCYFFRGNNLHNGNKYRSIVNKNMMHFAKISYSLPGPIISSTIRFPSILINVALWAHFFCKIVRNENRFPRRKHITSTAHYFQSNFTYCRWWRTPSSSERDPLEIPWK